MDQTQQDAAAASPRARKTKWLVAAFFVLLAAVAVGDAVEISRWLRRRRQMDEASGK